MNAADIVKALGAAGGQWVLYLLLACSMGSVTLMLERALYFWSNRESAGEVLSRGVAALARGRLGELDDNARGPVGRMLSLAARSWDLGPERLQAVLLAHCLQEKAAAERGLVFLGTLGNNAPFIGLFGTVLGIIRAFQDLATSNIQGPAAVMAGISSALVATAVGIFVAIPAVVAYNLCQRHIRVVDYRLEEAAGLIHATAIAAGKDPLYANR